MASDGSITRCIALLREGEDAAAQVIWERYYSQLVRLAHMQLGSLSRRVVDEEDIALSALDRICRALEQGRYPDLADRHGLWRLLLQITARRVADQARYERRQRRGSGRVHGETEGGDPPRLCSRSLDEAADAIAKMDGSANHEIAAEMGCSVRTVERRLKLIRDIWRDEEPE